MHFAICALRMQRASRITNVAGSLVFNITRFNVDQTLHRGVTYCDCCRQFRVQHDSIFTKYSTEASCIAYDCCGQLLRTIVAGSFNIDSKNPEASRITIVVGSSVPNIIQY